MSSWAGRQKSQGENMASAQSIDELLEQPVFIDMVKAIYDAISIPQLSRAEELDVDCY
jgi:hypothetical protein